MTVDLTAFNFALQEMYPDIVGRTNELDTPLLAMFPKRTDMTGESMNYPTVYANNAGRAGTLTAAQTASTGGKGVQWAITTIRDYGVIRIDGQTIRASGGAGSMSRGAAAAFLSARSEEMLSTVKALNESIAFQLYRSGTGVRAVRSSAAANVITLTNPTDAIFFDVGMIIGAATSADPPVARSGTATITAVTRSPVGGTSTITVDNIATIVGFVDGDGIYVSGDLNSRMKGLAAWVPSTAPGATSFFGVDRSVDTSRLGGLRYAGSEPLVERLVNAEAFARTQGGKLDVFAIHPTKLATIKNILADKIRFVDMKSASGRTSFRAVELDTDNGTVKLLGDPFCPVSTAYGLQLDTWKLVSMGECPGPLNHLGQDGSFFTMTSEDAIEGRLGYYAQVACSAPGYNITVSLS